MPHSVLDQIQIFQRLPETEVQQLLEAGVVETHPAGSVILNERDQLHSLYIVLEGRTEAFLPETQERISTVRLGDLAPGQCFAEYAFIDQQPASASIRALTDARVLCIEFEALRTLLEAKPAVASILYSNLASILVKRLRDSNAELDLFTLAF
ncbi:MAG: cyclic nucleotide-binding domain-containing protein [Xanthomonadales bacterium]|nr:cyclic nucleotide-binding domain-containing protein [Xanthomonadales bacterium]